MAYNFINVPRLPLLKVHQCPKICHFLRFINDLSICLDLAITGAEDPYCPIESLEIPVSRAQKAYEEAHSQDKFKVRMNLW